MIVKVLTEYHLEFLSLKKGCRGSTESTHIKMPHCWKSHATAKMQRSSTTTSISLIKSKTDRYRSFLKFNKSVDYQMRYIECIIRMENSANHGHTAP